MLNELVKALELEKISLEKEIENLAAEKRGKVEADRLSNRLSMINARSIKEYMALWQTFTPPGPFPCPFCYVFEGEVSPLKTQPRVEDVETVRCDKCGETIEIPVELLYA